MTNIVPILLFYTLSPPDIKAMSNKIGLIDDILFMILPTSYEAYRGIATLFCEKNGTISLYSLVVFLIYIQFTLSVYLPKYKDYLWVVKSRKIIVDWAIPSYYVVFFFDNTLFVLGLFHAKRPEKVERDKFIFLYLFIIILILMFIWYRLRYTLYFFGKSIWILYLFLLGLIMFLIKSAIAQSSHNLITKFITNFITTQFIRMTFLTYNNDKDDRVHGLHRHWIESKKKRNDRATIEKNKNSWWSWAYLGLMLAFILLVALHTFYDFGLNGYKFDLQYWLEPKCISKL